jgi:YD repeat-containing protein
MVATDNTKEAQNTADKIKSTDKGGEKGAASAYQALNSEVQQHYDQVGKNGYTQQDFKNYQTALVKDLQTNGTLPDISLEWAKDNKDILHKLSSKQGGDSGRNNLPDTGISHDAIGAATSLMQNNFNGELIKAYGAQLEAGGTFDAATAATGGDPGHDAYLGPKSTQAYFDQKDRVSGNRGLTDAQDHAKLSQLFQKGPNGEAPLIQQLDTAKDGGKADGNISSDDLNSWLNSHDKHDPNYQVVQDIKDGKFDGLKKQDGSTDKISDGFSVSELSSDFGISGISSDDIKNGKKSYGDLANAFNAAHNSDAVAPPSVVKDAAGNTTKISYDNGRAEQFEYDANGKINRITETPADGGAPVVYKANDKGVWGPMKADGTIDDSAGNKNPVITSDGQYAFQNKDGGWNVVDDHGNASAPSSDFSYKQNYPALDSAGKPIPGQTQTTEIAVNTSSQITGINYGDGSASKFTYDATDPTKVTGLTRTDSKGADTAFVRDSSGKWVTTDAQGNPTTTAAPFTDTSVDSAGNVSIVRDGKTLVVTPDNKLHSDTADGPVAGADPAATSTKPGDASKVPFETKTDAQGNTTFTLAGGSGHWLWNYADQLAKASGKDTNQVLDEIVKANRGQNGLSQDATGANPGNYEKGDYVIPQDLLPNPNSPPPPTN